MIEDYLDQTIALINESKLSYERKFKILANLRSALIDYFVNRRIIMYIDKKGFEHFKQKIQDEESSLECQNV